MKSIVIGFVSFLVILPEAWASNGLNAIGFGIESISIGGADVAVSRDTSALNTNPAGLAQIEDKQFDLEIAAAFAVNVGHRDQYGNDEQTRNNPRLADFGYVGRTSQRNPFQGHHEILLGVARCQGTGTGRLIQVRRSAGAPVVHRTKEET